MGHRLQVCHRWVSHVTEGRLDSAMREGDRQWSLVCLVSQYDGESESHRALTSVGANTNQRNRRLPTKPELKAKQIDQNKHTD